MISKAPIIGTEDGILVGDEPWSREKPTVPCADKQQGTLAFQSIHFAEEENRSEPYAAGYKNGQCFFFWFGKGITQGTKKVEGIPLSF